MVAKSINAYDETFVDANSLNIVVQNKNQGTNPSLAQFNRANLGRVIDVAAGQKIANTDANVANIDARLSSVETTASTGYTFKGSCNFSALPTSARTGDMYYVTDRSTNYAYNGSSWFAINDTGISWVLDNQGNYRLAIRIGE